MTVPLTLDTYIQGGGKLCNSGAPVNYQDPITLLQTPLSDTGCLISTQMRNQTSPLLIAVDEH
jgi:hypothetical protein